MTNLLKYRTTHLFLVLIAYLSAAAIGLYVTSLPGRVSPFWPPAGIALAANLWLGYYVWPAIFVSNALVHLYLFPFNLAAIVGACLVGAGASSQAFLGAYLLKKYAKTNDPFETSSAAFIFILFSSLFACLINSSVGTLTVVYENLKLSIKELLFIWSTWWIGDAMGALTFGSSLLAWQSWHPKKGKMDFLDCLESFIVYILLLILSWFIFIKHYPLIFMLIPFPIWATTRFRSARLGTLTALIISILTVLGASHGYTGLGAQTEQVELLLLQTFVGVIFVTTLMLSSILNEREKAYVEMEDKVIQRTQDLNEKNQTLTQTLISLEKAQEKIVEGERLVSNVINSLPSALIILDENQNIILWNNEAEKEAKVTLEKAKGQPVISLFPFLNPSKEKISHVFHLKKPQKIDQIAQRNEGDIRYFDLIIYPLIGGNILGSTILMQDVTEKIKLNENLQQQDKLASLGVLTAGIAHEINNPVNFIVGSIASLKQDVADVVSLLNQCLNLNENTDIQAQFKQIKEQKEKMDIDYIIQEINQLIKGIEEGGSRTSAIVKDLKTFSRLDESDMKKSDVREGIEATLTLLNHSIKGRIEIIREYTSVPLIDCYPGKLNQVFMNILSNAIQSIKDKGKIWIKIEPESDDKIKISIKDNGQGIEEKYLSRIFEPFFTTKEVGKGTGLGLSISYAIIEEHKGKISVSSQLGQGTEFAITLPIYAK